MKQLVFLIVSATIFAACVKGKGKASYLCICGTPGNTTWKSQELGKISATQAQTHCDNYKTMNGYDSCFVKVLAP